MKLGLTSILICLVVFGLLFLDCAVVVDEDESAFVLWVRVALSALVSRAEVALP